MASQIDRDIEAIFDYLVDNGPVEGKADEIADTLGITPHRFWSAVNRIRSSQFIADNRWTIPYVPKGLAPKLWTVADDREDVQAITDGSSIRLPEVVEYLRRAHAQVALAAAVGDKRTAEAKYAAYAQTSLAALVAGGELLLSTNGGS